MYRILTIILLSLCLCSTNYATEIIDSSKISQIKDKSICLNEVLQEYCRIGYYNQRSYEPITLNNIPMNARMDCSGFISAFIADYKKLITGNTKNQVCLSSIHFESEGDPYRKLFLDKLKFSKIEDLQIGDICWSGSHFIIYAGKTNASEAPFMFYHWSGETKKDNLDYKDYKATEYCILQCNLDYIKKKGKNKGIKILPVNNNYAGIMNSKEYTNFYRIKE